ncbi:MAG: IS1634 family transposase [Chloroflexi bacterium]|nr:IS1634 family transposase [Chloroflexota bacterium]
MHGTTRVRGTRVLVWLFWFVALLALAWGAGLPGDPLGASREPVLLAGLALPEPAPHDLFPWRPQGRWRRWAWRRYQAARRVYQRARWAYYQAVWAARLARLLLGGVLTMATVVDLLTRAQLRRQLGALPVLYALLEILQVRQVINRHCPTAAEIDHGTVALVLVLNRLTAPRALYLVADWLAQTVLVQVLGVPAAKFNDDRLGRTLDAIAAQQREIWLGIVHEALLRFDIDLRFIFYDLTAFVMQGEFTDSDLADYGFAHNTPMGKKKVKLGVAAASDGAVPVEYAPLSGRTADIATVQDNMERLCRLLERQGYPVHEVLVIGDRGTLNPQLALQYEEQHLKYLASLQPQQKAHRELLRAVPTVQFRAYPLTAERGARGYWGHFCAVPFQHDGQTVTHRGLVVLSGPMRHARRVTRAQQLRALRAELTAVQAKIGQKRYRTVKAVQARANTCLRRSPVGHLMQAEAAQHADGTVTLGWWINTHALWQASQTDGRYLLVTNDFTLSAQRMLELYRAKDELDKRFLVSKQDLRVRPIYLHQDDRIEAMLLLNMIALLAYSLLEREVRQHGLPLTLRRLIAQLENLTVIETHCWDGSVLYRLTPVSADQQALLAVVAQILAQRCIPRVRPTLSPSWTSRILRAPPPGPLVCELADGWARQTTPRPVGLREATM